MPLTPKTQPERKQAGFGKELGRCLFSERGMIACVLVRCGREREAVLWVPGTLGFPQEKGMGTALDTHQTGGLPGSPSPCPPTLQALTISPS